MNKGPSPGPIPILQSIARKRYTPILSALERRAYRCAYRLLHEYHLRPISRGDVADGRDGKALAMPGAVRSRLVDAVARMLMQEMGK
jgi:hypothetical protein